MKNGIQRVSWALALGSMLCASAFAQEDDDDLPDGDDGTIEEILVIGSQIRGASISGALPTTVLQQEDIEALGIDSGSDLLEFIAENGQNFFSEAENVSGGVNSARGDIGAYNLRNLGTGNTLVLLNGRRLVNAASYQTEEVGGSFVPVNTVNSQSLPIAGLRRVEVLKDGASAIYGADAVAGVVNYVLRDDFEGLSIRTKLTEFDHLPRSDQTFGVEFGKNFNDGRTNFAVFLNHYRRDRVSSQDEARWANSDFRSRVPEDSPWADAIVFRNNSANSAYRQYDAVPSASGLGISGVLSDSAGDIETFPSGDPRCEYEIGYGTCGAIDGNGTFRYNLNENRDLASKLDRTNFYAFLNHEFEGGIEAYTEFSLYMSNTNTIRQPSAPFSTVDLRVGADNYWNPLGPCTSPNRLDDSIIGTDVPCTGVALTIENGRFTEVPRVVDNDGKTYRFLQGFRGEFGKWDWDTAFIWSRAEKEDITRNRISNTLMQQALEDATPAAYNPFSGGIDSNIERTLVDVRRDNETELMLVDFKISRNDLYELPAGPVGFLAGLEFREESFVDDRDPRLDGTINFTDFDGDTYPFVSDIVNSSPTPDSRGERDVASLFAEFQIPIIENLDAQVALRYEDFSDVGSTTVGKLALGYRPIEPLLLRASWSEAFRAPNLVTVNEEIVARQNTRTDFTCLFAADNGGDPDQDTLDCVNSIQRIAQGSDQLQPEESTNYSVGFALDPLEGMTITLDFWSIEKENTIGLFGEENHTILDLVQRLSAGTANCAAFNGNPAISREASNDPAADAIYLAAGICPAGDIEFITDNYANLDTRTVRGHDIGFYYNFDSALGNFDIRLIASYLDKFEQAAGGDAALLVAAQADGTLPDNIPVLGFASLIRQDGNVEEKQTIRLGWNYGPYSAALSGVRVGDFIQTSLTLDDGTQYVIPSMTTFNLTGNYRFDLTDTIDGRVRIGVNNVFDERAPLADDSFGFFADVHRDFGRSYYAELKLDF